MIHGGLGGSRQRPAWRSASAREYRGWPRKRLLGSRTVRAVIRPGTTARSRSSNPSSVRGAERAGSLPPARISARSCADRPIRPTRRWGRKSPAAERRRTADRHGGPGSRRSRSGSAGLRPVRPRRVGEDCDRTGGERVGSAVPGRRSRRVDAHVGSSGTGCGAATRRSGSRRVMMPHDRADDAIPLVGGT